MNNTTLTAGWISDPCNGRGTLSLLYGCIFTVYICSWSAIHLNVPADNDSHWTILLRKSRWMLVTILAPEFTTTYSWHDWKEARELVKSLNAPITKGEPRWNMTHAYFVVMGGFAVQCGSARPRVSTDCFLALVKAGCVQLRPDLEAEIRDKSKASSIAKLAACVQITWFLAQLIGRADAALPITVLEMFTLAIVICSLVSYAFWWKKPLDVARPIVLDVRYPTDVEKCLEALEAPAGASTANPKFTRERRWNLVPLYIEPFGTRLSTFTMMLVPLFASCHLIAWNWAFPSEAERNLWRICSVSCFVLPELFGLAAWAPAWFRRNIAIVPLITAYFLLRMCMVAETFAALRSVPGGVYDTVNLPPLPHF